MVPPACCGTDLWNLPNYSDMLLLQTPAERYVATDDAYDETVATVRMTVPNSSAS